MPGDRMARPAGANLAGRGSSDDAGIRVRGAAGRSGEGYQHAVRTIKALGTLLYAPALIYMFPEVPQWIGEVFPTYYIRGPVVEISQRGGARPDVALEVLILIGLILALAGCDVVVARRTAQRPAWRCRWVLGEHDTDSTTDFADCVNGGGEGDTDGHGWSWMDFGLPAGQSVLQ